MLQGTANIRPILSYARSCCFRLASRRSISFDSIPAVDTYEHVSNMPTRDLFQFEPFNNANLVNFPRETPNNSYALNWSLAGEWITVWGNAWGNPDRSTLMQRIKGLADERKNIYCKRNYKQDSDVRTIKEYFEERSDDVKEYLSEVPDLFVEDAAVCSGKGFEMRIRSITNDPVTALALKNMLHRMPVRHPQTPHPLSVIVARGMSETYTAIGKDLHSRSLTVLAAGDVPIQRILNDIVVAAQMQLEEERGQVEMKVASTEPGKPEQIVKVKGAISKVILRDACCVVDRSGASSLVFGLSDEAKMLFLAKNRLFCNGNVSLSRDGLSRAFVGVSVPVMEELPSQFSNQMVVNQRMYQPVTQDNILSLPSRVLFAKPSRSTVILDDTKAIAELTSSGLNDESSKFVMNTLSSDKSIQVLNVDDQYVRDLL